MGTNEVLFHALGWALPAAAGRGEKAEQPGACAWGGARAGRGRVAWVMHLFCVGMSDNTVVLTIKMDCGQHLCYDSQHGRHPILRHRRKSPKTDTWSEAVMAISIVAWSSGFQRQNPLSAASPPGIKMGIPKALNVTLDGARDAARVFFDIFWHQEFRTRGWFDSAESAVSANASASDLADAKRHRSEHVKHLRKQHLVEL